MLHLLTYLHKALLSVSSSNSTCQPTVDTELIAYFGDANASDHSCSLSYGFSIRLNTHFLHLWRKIFSPHLHRRRMWSEFFSVTGDLCAGKRNRLTKGLEMRAFLKCNHKYYE